MPEVISPPRSKQAGRVGDGIGVGVSVGVELGVAVAGGKGLGVMAGGVGVSGSAALLVQLADPKVSRTNSASKPALATNKETPPTR